MQDDLVLRDELKKKFLREFTASEKLYFLKVAREAVLIHRYPVSEDLFYYCYFMTMRQRLRSARPERGDGLLRFILVEGIREIEDEIKLYKGRLEAHRLPEPDSLAERFLEYLSH
ncbi:MAG TPA: hypothetical protein ENK09_05440 [Nitrospirae bacterium]|nr:hypothetical protein [Nitrospirota bacterium]